MSKRRVLRRRHRNRGKLKAARREERKRHLLKSVTRVMAKYIQAKLGEESIGRKVFAITPLEVPCDLSMVKKEYDS